AGRLVHVGHGVVRCDPTAALERRLQQIFAELSAAMALFRPDAVAVEGVFAFKNARSALVLGHARGVALLVAAQRGLGVHEYPPARVKKSIGAGGNDSKEAVSRMVHALLRVGRVERQDAIDALAVAICHLHQRGSSRSVGSRGKKNGFAVLADRLAPAYVPAGAAR
ncbi:MAG: crossover junction endodeoxyribonuclease RuvC, partial [Myxococcota bacterium]